LKKGSSQEVAEPGKVKIKLINIEMSSLVKQDEENRKYFAQFMDPKIVKNEKE
jgi:hypothetical protein